MYCLLYFFWVRLLCMWVVWVCVCVGVWWRVWSMCICIVWSSFDRDSCFYYTHNTVWGALQYKVDISNLTSCWFLLFFAHWIIHSNPSTLAKLYIWVNGKIVYRIYLLLCRIKLMSLTKSWHFFFFLFFFSVRFHAMFVWHMFRTLTPLIQEIIQSGSDNLP